MSCRACSNISGHLLLLYASNCRHRLILTNNFSLPVRRIHFVNEHFKYLAFNSMQEGAASSVTFTAGLLWVWICVNFTCFLDVCVGFFQKECPYVACHCECNCKWLSVTDLSKVFPTSHLQSAGIGFSSMKLCKPSLVEWIQMKSGVGINGKHLNSCASVAQGLGARLTTSGLYEFDSCTAVSDLPNIPPWKVWGIVPTGDVLRYMRSDGEAHFPLSLTTLLSTRLWAF